MEAFFPKVKSVFAECHCELDKSDSNEETILFRHRPYNNYLIKFELKVFFEKLQKLADETPELRERLYISINFAQLDDGANYNIFGKPIPRQIGGYLDYKPRLHKIEDVAEEFIDQVNRDRFVDFKYIEVVFSNINDV